MSINIEQNLLKLVNNFTKEDFIFDLLLAYGFPKSTVTLLKKGKSNLSKKDDQIIIKKKLFFWRVESQDLHEAIDYLSKDDSTYRHNPRFIIVTNYKTILAIDTKINAPLDIEIKDLHKHFDFFLPWAGMEKTSHQNENPADVKAAEKMAKIYDEILKDNKFTTKDNLHSLNIFLSRLLFCFFAEDTGIFKKGVFTNSIASHTKQDGSDLNQYLNRLFEALNTKDNSHYPNYLKEFPYVNGGLFGDRYFAPEFSAKSRKMLIDCGELDWSAINPDIFGSMIQAVAHPDQRGGLGMHYTSVPNIMKVIEPLFLNDLKEILETHRNEPKALNKLLERISNIKIFDPACGSGNFLIIAYKELRNLEIEILLQLQKLQRIASGFESRQLEIIPKSQLNLAAQFHFDLFSRIRLCQFYGIELDDFAHEVAILSLWLAEHQMNVKFKEIFGSSNPTLPLKEGGKIVCGNATRVNWEDVCPKDESAEIYIIGNPPYLGARNQDEKQKEDMDAVFKGYLPKFRDLDYIACWFFKASRFIQNTNSKFAFVSTNSICQGDSVGLLWPHLFDIGVDILFAHTSFKWQNNAKYNAGVTVAIIGVKPINLKIKKFLFTGINRTEVANISPYLASGSNIVVSRTNKPISRYLPKMNFGNMPADGGELILSTLQKDEILQKDSKYKKIIRRLVGSQEFIRGQERYCLWIGNEDLQIALSSPLVKKRIENVREIRKKSARPYLAERPHQFAQMCHKNTNSIIVPSVSSDRREYIPIGFLDKDTIISNLGLAIYDADPWIFAVLTSKMHTNWVAAIGGRLGNGYRYSAEICYNTFPIPDLTDKQKQTLTSHVYNILEEREKYPEKTMAELYDPDKMPTGLKEAHHNLDLAVERCYRSKPFTNDEERLEYLFKLYEKMINEERLKVSNSTPLK